MRKGSLGVGLVVLLGLVWLAVERARTPAKVVVVSLDGAADWLVDDYLERGVLPADGALARMARTGTRAEAMIPVAASMTASSHVTMFTGAYPERHGIVSNHYHTAGDPITRSTGGFDAPIQAETLWQAARRQGKRVLCVGAVGATGTAPERSCDLTLGYGQRVGWSAVVGLRADGEEQIAGAGNQFEHVRRLRAKTDSQGRPRFRFNRRDDIAVQVLAGDSEFDGNERYDTLLLDLDDDIGNGFAARLRGGEWAPVILPVEPAAGPARIGSWVKLLELRGDLGSARLYLGAPHHNRGAPESYVAALEGELGFWPGTPDDTNLDRGLLDEHSWQEQAERLSNYLRDAALFSMSRQEWDLLLTYQPLADEVQHPFLLRDPRQPAYDAESGARRSRYAGYVEWSYQTVDRVLLALMDAAPKETHLVVVSDHGMVPVHTRVMLNTALARAGFRVTRDESSQVRAYTSGSTAHIRVNLAGREPHAPRARGESAAVVPPEKLSEYVERIVAACRSLRDPVTREPVFERVLRRSELGEVHLAHPRTAGDVWVNARPGYALSGEVEPLVPNPRSTPPAANPRRAPTGAVFEQATAHRGEHGYLGKHREVRAIFFASGPKIRWATLEPVQAVDVAPTVSALLGMEPPAQSQGRNVLRPPQ